MQAVQGFPGCAEGHGAVMGKWEVAPDCDLSDNQGLRWQSRRTCAHLLLRELQSYNLLLNNHQQENVGSTKKKIPYVQGQRRSPSKMVGGVKSCLELNLIPTRDA